MQREYPAEIFFIPKQLYLRKAQLIILITDMLKANTMNYNDVIIRPVISEKSTDMSEKSKYVFQVATRANKHIIKKAIKEIFKVNPIKINVIMVRGKSKRVRYQYGYTTSWKKAIVTIGKGEKIELFENQ
jgi:large subunit ribosomal protein L23